MSFGNAWSRLFPRNPSHISRLRRWFRLRLEHLEDRTLPSVSLLFDSAAGQLSLHGDGSDAIVRQTLSSAGFLEIAVDGQLHSGDPKSAFFDQALAGANAGNLAATRLDGGGHDTLILAWDGFENRPTGSLTVTAAGAEVVTQDITIAGKLTIQAQRVTVEGAVRASAIALAGSGWVTIEARGHLAANQISVAADVFVNSGRLDANGATGRQIFVSARNVLNAGPMTANGTTGAGGSVQISFTDSYIDTAAALTSANGAKDEPEALATGLAPGGNVTIDGGTSGRLFSSGRHQATGSVGGSVNLFGQAVVLDGATVDASGDFGGGSIHIGGQRMSQVANLPSTGGQVDNLSHRAATVSVTSATTIRADARTTGTGGRVLVWSDQDTHFDGLLSARGGPAGGDGGVIEVSSGGTLTYGGTADAGAPAGKAGTLLLDPKNLIIDATAGVYPQFDLIDPHPSQFGRFGMEVSVLSNGNIVVINSSDNFGGSFAGAVYLFDGLTGVLISSLIGSNPNDRVGLYGTGGAAPPDVTPMTNGNYVIDSALWNGNRGAVTWGSGITGVSGVVSAVNSLVGSNPNDSVGTDSVGGANTVTPLNNGNYLVRSVSWNGNRGAVTWGNGTTGVSGIISEANSLVGTNPGSVYTADRVGSGGIGLLSSGNYVVQSSHWNGGLGAATWGSAATGVSGTISATNSLVGTDPGDRVGTALTYGSRIVTPLSNGNYVVLSPWWNGQRGAATWGNGATGVSGTISATNSLVGSSPNDRVGGANLGFVGITLLSNGNYVVASPSWGGGLGAVTWGDGILGVTGLSRLPIVWWAAMRAIRSAAMTSHP
jgi:hypothetical protein